MRKLAWMMLALACGPIGGGLGQGSADRLELPAAKRRYVEQMDQLVRIYLGKIAADPEQGRLRPQFLMGAVEALKAVNAMTPARGGMNGHADAESQVSLLQRDENTAGESLIWIALSSFVMERYEDGFDTKPAGTLPAVTPRMRAQEQSCSEAIDTAIHSHTVQDPIDECDVMAFERLRRKTK